MMHFIDIAENTGVSDDITRCVINEALTFCNKLRAHGLDISIAGNVSVQNLLNEDFATSVIAAVAQLDLLPSSLILEVIESNVIEDMEQTVTILEELDQAGIQISLDDFGTG